MVLYHMQVGIRRLLATARVMSATPISLLMIKYLTDYK